MSLAIEVHRVVQVLLADGWHAVANASFDVDAYEYLHDERVLVGGGQVQYVPSMGAIWEEPDGGLVACPLNAIHAVKLAAPTSPRSA
jgi:hypothetical protein